MAYHAIYTNLTLRHTARGLWFRPMTTQVSGAPKKRTPYKERPFLFSVS